jgi:NADH dehydrogenase FAD-containing subunit
MKPEAHPTIPDRKNLKNVLLVGAGESNIYLVRHAHRLQSAGISLTWLLPESMGFYAGAVPEVLTGEYGLNNFRMDLPKLAQRNQVRVVMDYAEELLHDLGQVQTARGERIPYDVAVFAIGAQIPREEDIPVEGRYFIQPLERILEIRNEIETILELEFDRPLRLVVLGGGRAGVQIACALAALLQHRKPDRSWSVHILEKNNRLLSSAPLAASRFAGVQCAKLGVAVRLQHSVEHIQSGRVILDSGESISWDMAIVTWQQNTHPIFWRADLHTSEQYSVKTKPTGQTVDLDNVFATGSCASGGVCFASSELLENIVRLVQGRELKAFSIVPAGWEMLSLGSRIAMGIKHSWVLSGCWVKWMKKTRDHYRMAYYQRA